MGNRFQNGAVSMFAVIFAAILLTVLTVGFIKIMIEDQSRATDNDLSQSAYDASLAGVEDAKRALQLCYRNGNPTACNALDANTNDCSVISRARGGGVVNETIVRSSTTSGEEFNQAYTCVNIDMLTDDYLLELNEGDSEVIPLRSNANFNQIMVEWYTQDDIGAGVTPVSPGGSADDLRADTAWPSAAPPLMRAQLIRPGSSFDLNSIDTSNASQTVFMKPIGMVASPFPHSVSVAPGASRPADSPHENVKNTPNGITCTTDFLGNNGYSCRATLDLSPEQISQPDSSNAFLRLSAIYNSASVRISMLNSGSPVKFNGVQPAVDSTGRASDLYRRVMVRLKMGDDFPYPNYSVDVNKDLCKHFSVTAESVIGDSSVCNPV